MKKDRMLEKIIEMTIKLTKYELREVVDKANDDVKEANKWLVEYRKRDELQLAKMVEQADEKLELKARITDLEAELAGLRGQA